MTASVLSSHLWEKSVAISERLGDRFGDAAIGAQEKAWAQAQALVKLPRGRNGDPLPVSVLANEWLASEIGQLLGLSVNEVLLAKLVSPSWGDAQDTWASVHCLVPEPFQRLDELPADRAQAISNCADMDGVGNADELRALPLFDHLILNGDRHNGNILVSGGRGSDLWLYFIDHGYAFGGQMADSELGALMDPKAMQDFMGQRSQLRAWWGSASDDRLRAAHPLAERILRVFDDTQVRSLVTALPDDVASASTRQFLSGVLEYQLAELKNLLSGTGPAAPI